MARGKNSHDERVNAVQGLGKSISRRAGHKCELCGSDRELRIVEVPPVDEDPDASAALLGCRRCRDAMEAKRLDAEDLRFLEGAIWAEPVPVRVAAIRLMRRLAEDQVVWARACLDGLWIDEELEARLQR